MKKGWILLHRKIYQSNDFRGELDRSVFIFLLCQASYEATQVVYRKKRINLNRGQLLITYGDIAKKFSISVQNARTIIKNLKLTGTLTVSLTRGLMKITIEKYIKYQDIDVKSNQKLTGSLTNRRKNTNNINNTSTTSIGNKYNKVIDMKKVIINKSSIPTLQSLNKVIKKDDDELTRILKEKGRAAYEEYIKKNTC